MWKRILAMMFFLSTISVFSHGQQRTQCDSVGVPSGWVTINITTNPNCGPGVNNQKTIQFILPLLTDATVTACNDGVPIPTGWVITSFQSPSSGCGSTVQYVLRNFNGEPSSTTKSVCSQTSVLPKWWVITAITTNVGSCGAGGILWTILNTWGILSSTTETVCQISPIPPGWQAIGSGTSSSCPSSNITTTIRSNNTAAATAHVFETSADQHVHDLTLHDGTWHDDDLMALTGAPNAASGTALTGYTYPANSSNPSSQHVFYVGTDQNLYELFWLNDAWFTNNLGAGVASGSPLTSFSSTFNGVNSQQVYFMSPSQHVIELARSNSDSGNFSSTDLMNATGAPAAVANSDLTSDFFIFNGSEQRHVYYVAADQHLHQLDWAGSWFHFDLMNYASGAPNILAGSRLAAVYFVFGQSQQEHIYYLAGDLHVHQIDWAGSWFHFDLMNYASGAPNALSGSALAGIEFTVSGSQQEHVYYLSSDSHVHQLEWAGNWYHNDIMNNASGAPNAVSSTPLSGFQHIASSVQEHQFYLAADNHVHDLEWDSNWQTIDVTSSAGATNVASATTLTSFSFPSFTNY